LRGVNVLASLERAVVLRVLPLPALAIDCS